MKRILTIGVAILIVFGSVYTVYAAQDVVNTKHNLSTSAPASNTFYLSGTTGDPITAAVCVFCHTPHFGSTTQQPLWNRTDPSGPYQMYNNAWSSTIDMTVAGSPQGVSLACLSCHDGTLGFDSLVNKPGSGLGAPSGWTFAGGSDITTSANAYIDTDLRNDHPISITYNTSDDSAFNSLNANGKIGPIAGVELPIYSGRVECGSCHDPHERDNATFLRVLNTASQLCTGCHIK